MAGRGLQQQERQRFSLFARGPLPHGSPLAVEVDDLGAPPEGPKVLAYDSLDAGGSGKAKAKPGRTGLLQDKPVVFHARIRSSGYGQAASQPPGRRPPRPAASSAARSAATISSTAPALGPLLRDYPMDCGPPIDHVASPSEEDVLLEAPSPTPLLHVAYSGDAQTLLTAAGDGTVQVHRLHGKTRRGVHRVLVAASSAPVRQASPSHDGRHLITASDDGHARIWALPPSPAAQAAPPRKRPQQQPLVLTLRPPSDDGGDGKATTAKAAAPPPPVVGASFFYLDKLALVASGRCLYLYAYHLAPPPRDALLRHHAEATNASRARPVHRWVHAHAQGVTAFDCINGALSATVVSAASDRSLALLDAAAGRFLRIVPDAHERPIHTVCLPRPSTFAAEIQRDRLELFATAATDGVATLWDVRKKVAAVAHFAEHVNRREKVGLAFSPCMRYLATGSENRVAYLYDLRKDGLVHTTLQPDELQGGEQAPRTRRLHVDVVSSVAFDPLRPRLATASYDGSVRFFGPAAAGEDEGEGQW